MRPRKSTSSALCNTRMRGHVCSVSDFFDLRGFLHRSQVIFSVKSSTAVKRCAHSSSVHEVDPFCNFADKGLRIFDGGGGNGNDRSKYGSYRTDLQ